MTIIKDIIIVGGVGLGAYLYYEMSNQVVKHQAADALQVNSVELAKQGV